MDEQPLCVTFIVPGLVSVERWMLPTKLSSLRIYMFSADIEFYCFDQSIYSSFDSKKLIPGLGIS